MALVTSSTRFAPISTEPSLRVRLVSWYFTIGGGLRLLSIVIALIAMLTMRGTHLDGPFPVLGIVGAIATALGSLWTGMLVAQRKRLGLLIGGISFAAPLAAALVGQHVSTGGAVFCLVGLALIASVWREVTEARERAERERD